MKKNQKILGLLLLFVVVFFAKCKNSTTETTTDTVVADSVSIASDDLTSSTSYSEQQTDSDSLDNKMPPTFPFDLYYVVRLIKEDGCSIPPNTVYRVRVPGSGWFRTLTLNVNASYFVEIKNVPTTINFQFYSVNTNTNVETPIDTKIDSLQDASSNNIILFHGDYFRLYPVPAPPHRDTIIVKLKCDGSCIVTWPPSLK